MPPIQIQLDSPINAAKAASPTSSRSGITPSPATTTATGSSASPYTPARPSAVASFATPTHTSTSLEPSPSRSPTRTTAPPHSDGPPPPQPGAVPVPSSGYATPRSSRHSRDPSAASTGRKDSIYAPSNPFTSEPPPPMPAIVPTAMPRQLSIPPPQTNYATPDSTSTPSFTNPAYQTSSYDPPRMGSLVPAPPPPETSSYYSSNAAAYTYGAAAPPPTLVHPPGYQQNPYADAMTPSARANQAAHERRPSVLSGLAEAVGVSGNDSTSFETSPADEGAWGAAKKWMGGVAEKAAQVEGEVWRRFSTTR